MFGLYTLCGLEGLAERAADLAAELDHSGPVIDACGVHSHHAELLRSLHTQSWFKFGGADEVLVTDKGGRQGCRFGGQIFNAGYARALGKVKQLLIDENLIPSFPMSVTNPFWSMQPNDSCSDSINVPLFDATFVDDEAIVCTCRDACKLNHIIERVVSIVHSVFSDHMMTVNYSRAKPK